MNIKLKKILNDQPAVKKILCLNIVLMLLYTKSIHWPWEFKGKTVLAVMMLFYLLMLIGIPYVVYKSKKVSDFINHVFHTIAAFFVSAWKNWKHTLRIILVYFSIAIFWYIVCTAYAKASGTYTNDIYVCMLTGICYVILTVFFLRNSIAEKPERLFYCILMIIGTTFIIATPSSVGASWDDGIHFFRSESIVQYPNVNGESSDNLEIEIEQTFLKNASKETRSQIDQALNESTIVPTNYQYSYGFFSIAYVPYAMGLVIGKALSFPFTWTFRFAKIFNLAFYGMIVFLAMKKIKAGKILVATIALIPTVVFMASNYAYDQWVIGFTLYGFCYFISFLQDRNKKITAADEWLMLGAFVVGILPKAVYFIMMLPLFFMPRTAFIDEKQHKKYLLYVLMSGLLLVATFTLPLLIAGAGSGDERGGTEVNATAQIQFILSNPRHYFDILTNFLGEYLNVKNAGQYIQNFAYLGIGSFQHISTVVLGTVALLDKNGYKSKNGLLCVSSYIGAFIAIVLSATALYISFTPVGSLDIVGCQYRYIIPVLFLFLYMLAPDTTENHMNKFWFNSLPMMFMGITFLYNALIAIGQLY